MMNKTMDGVQKLVDQELKMANEQYPLFASNHEGAAVLLEEIEEAEADMQNIKIGYRELWVRVKANNALVEYYNSLDVPEDIENAAIHCACECIQVAAMCEKIKLKKNK